DDRRDLRESGHLSGAPAPLAGDDLVASRLAPVRGAEDAHHDGLHHALRLDGVGELGERLVPHVHARLVAAALQHIERELRELLACGRGSCGDVGRGAGAEQVRESTSQRRFSVNNRDLSSPVAWAWCGSPAGPCPSSSSSSPTPSPSSPEPSPATAAANALSCATASCARAAKASSSRRIISPASARYASAPRDSLS